MKLTETIPQVFRRRQLICYNDRCRECPEIRRSKTNNGIDTTMSVAKRPRGRLLSGGPMTSEQIYEVCDSVLKTTATGRSGEHIAK